MPSLRIFNPDGSEAEKSGNGLRIFAKYLFEKKYVRGKSFKIKTLGGIVDVQVKDETANLIRIDMGKVTFISNEIPVAGPKREVVNETLDINGTEYKVTCLSIGNPHCVIPMKEVSEETARSLGPARRESQDVPQPHQHADRASDRPRQHRHSHLGARGRLHAGLGQQLLRRRRRDAQARPGGQRHHRPHARRRRCDIEIAHDGQIRMTGPVEGTFEGNFHQGPAARESQISNSRCSKHL